MKRRMMLFVVSLLVLSLLAGCAGTTVVVNQPSADAPAADVETAATEDAESSATPETVEGALKTGLAIIAGAADSVSATESEEGTAKYDITVAVVAVDDAGVIRACRLDSVGATVTFDASGAITSDLTAPVLTKNELGADYGMVAWGGAIAEWDAQAAALCDFAIGKTVEELKSGAIDETGRAPAGSDLASSATIYLGGYVSAIEAAVNNAQPLGAQAGDDLALAIVNSLGKSAAATADAEGTAQLYTTVAVITSRDGVITSCLIDAVQANVNFDAVGVITSDLSAPMPTKNELGADYGMVAWGGAIAEWNEQAASFAAYITGKTAADVAGIAVDEKTTPTEEDLRTSVTIKIGDFQKLIEKALG